MSERLLHYHNGHAHLPNGTIIYDDSEVVGPSDVGKIIIVVAFALMLLLLLYFIWTAELMERRNSAQERLRRSSMTEHRLARSISEVKRDLVANMRSWHASIFGTEEAIPEGHDDDIECDNTVESDGDTEIVELPSPVANECAICLDPFDEGQVICQSQNPACSHIFHSDCVAQWLQKHGRCPICRSKYIIEHTA